MKTDTLATQVEIHRISHSQDVQFNAPIHLLSKLSDESKEAMTIMLILQNNPEAAHQGEHEKKVTTFMGTSMESYCYFGQVYDEFPLNTPQKKFADFVQLLGGSNMEAWHSIMDGIEVQMEGSFQEAVNAFVHHFMVEFM